MVYFKITTNSWQIQDRVKNFFSPINELKIVFYLIYVYYKSLLFGCGSYLRPPFLWVRKPQWQIYYIWYTNDCSEFERTFVFVNGMFVNFPTL